MCAQDFCSRFSCFLRSPLPLPPLRPRQVIACGDQRGHLYVFSFSVGPASASSHCLTLSCHTAAPPSSPATPSPPPSPLAPPFLLARTPSHPSYPLSSTSTGRPSPQQCCQPQLCLACWCQLLTSSPSCARLAKWRRQDRTCSQSPSILAQCKVRNPLALRLKHQVEGRERQVLLHIALAERVTWWGQKTSRQPPCPLPSHPP